MGLDLNQKRPAKQICESFILNQYASLKAGIPGLTKEIVKAQIGTGNYYLYETEAKEILQKAKNNPDFNGQDFVEHLKFFGCIKPGEAPAFGSGGIGVDSIERAREVANDPADAEKVQSIMAQMTALREQINPLIDKKSECSIALKNKKGKKKKSATS